jgi:hypothetical protein
VCLQQCCSSSSVVGRIGKTKGALPGRSRNFSYRDGATCRPQRTCICMHAPPSAQQSLPSFVVSWTRPTSSSQVAPPSHKSDTLRCARSPERGRQVAVGGCCRTLIMHHCWHVFGCFHLTCRRPGGGRRRCAWAAAVLRLRPISNALLQCCLHYIKPVVCQCVTQ